MLVDKRRIIAFASTKENIKSVDFEECQASSERLFGWLTQHTAFDSASPLEVEPTD